MEAEQERVILSILGEATDMSLATLRPDGWPQANIVTFVSQGLDIYFSADPASGKVQNIALDDRVSATVALPHPPGREIKALSLAGRAERVEAAEELAAVARLVIYKFSPAHDPRAGDLDGLAVFRIRPTVVSLLDYARDFGRPALITL